MMEALTGVLVAITAFYAWVTHRIMLANTAMVETMRAQMEATTRPYLTITAFVVPNSYCFYLRIANTGRSAASKVRLTLDRDFFQFGDPKQNLREMVAFQQTIEQLSPGAELIFMLAPAVQVLGDRPAPDMTPPVFAVAAQYSFGGNSVSEETTIDLRPYKATVDTPSPLLDQLEKMAGQLEKIAGR
jgi:hypothetical protein